MKKNIIVGGRGMVVSAVHFVEPSTCTHVWRNKQIRIYKLHYIEREIIFESWMTLGI